VTEKEADWPIQREIEIGVVTASVLGEPTSNCPKVVLPDPSAEVDVLVPVVVALQLEASSHFRTIKVKGLTEPITSAEE
jgi:hypothetical protein